MSFDYQIEVFLTPSILFMTIENGNFPNRMSVLFLYNPFVIKPPYHNHMWQIIKSWYVIK